MTKTKPRSKKLTKSHIVKSVEQNAEQVSKSSAPEEGAVASVTGLVASEELEVVKAMEQGPTEAELRRRALIEADSDEDEERQL